MANSQESFTLTQMTLLKSQCFQKVVSGNVLRSALNLNLNVPIKVERRSAGASSWRSILILFLAVHTLCLYINHNSRTRGSCLFPISGGKMLKHRAPLLVMKNMSVMS